MQQTRLMTMGHKKRSRHQMRHGEGGAPSGISRASSVGDRPLEGGGAPLGVRRYRSDGNSPEPTSAGIHQGQKHRPSTIPLSEKTPDSYGPRTPVAKRYRSSFPEHEEGLAAGGKTGPGNGDGEGDDSINEMYK